jgi:hypothetical protein
MRKEKKSEEKNIINLPGSLATFGNFKRILRSRPILIFPTMCNLITRSSFVPGVTLCHLHMSTILKSVFFSLPPPWNIIFQ